MSTIGYATLSVVPTFAGLQRELDKGVAGPMAASGRTAGTRFGDAAGRASGESFKSRMSSSLRGYQPLAGIALGAGLIKGLTDVIGQASEAQQAVGGVQAVFGEYADSVLQDSARAAQGLGLSAAAYQQLVTVSGALLKNKGLTDYADQSERLVSIGADLAAQFGGETQTAVEALNAALRGESDPIERYAISLNETAVNAELAARGQSKLEGAALDAAKTQARLALIIEQSADAQGAFARESDTLAGAQARTTAQFADMRAELGERLLPATQAFVSVVNGQVLPAVGAFGETVGAAAGAVNALPTPLKAAAAGWAAYAIAQRAGLGTASLSSFNGVRSGLDSVRIRAMLAGDEYRRLSRGTIELNGNLGRTTPALGRMTSSLGAVRVGAAGAGTALKRGLGGAVSLLGGPWGLAFAGAGIALTEFARNQSEANARVSELTGLLDQQTGAITANYRANVLNKLVTDGSAEAADRLGISAAVLTDAALGNAEAIDRVTASLERQGFTLYSGGNGFTDFVNKISGAVGISDEMALAAERVSSAINQENDTVAKTRREYELLRQGQASTTETFKEYTGTLGEARAEVRKLLDAENDRRKAATSDRRDRIGLLNQLADARKEAREGKLTLDENTRAGRENATALLDLADQWNNSSDSVRNARGAYAEIRRSFVELADQMNGPNGTRADARALADELLGLSRKRAIDIETKGMDKALKDLERLKALIPDKSLIQFNFTRAQQGAGQALAGGGLVRGIGTGTSDSNLIWGSRGEFMQRKAAVDYYGVDFMRALNKMQIPRFATGGEIGAPAPRPSVAGGVSVQVGQVVAHDYEDFMRQMQRRARTAAGGGVNF